MRLVACLLAPGLLWAESPAADQAGPRGLVQQAVDRYFESLERLRVLTYKRRTERKEFDGNGILRSRTCTTTTTEFVDGVRWSYVSERDDKPLNDLHAIQTRVRGDVAEWKSKTPQQRRRILEQARKRGRNEAEYLREFAQALDFMPAGKENKDGRPALVFSFQPRPGYKPKALEGRLYEGVRGNIWIDEAERHMVRLEASVFKDLSIGGFLAKVEKGTHFEFDQARVEEGFWAPRRQLLRFDVRLLMLKQIHNVVEARFVDYRKYNGPLFSDD